jgi:ADP-ribose pyrophosphatase
MPHDNSVPSSSPAALTDEAADVAVSAPELLSDVFRRYELYRLSLALPDGARLEQTRAVLRVGRVIGVLAVDPARAEVVLIRQFRLAAHLATGQGSLIEIVAGHVEPDEAPVAAARRECMEEIGVAPEALYEMFSFMPAPGAVDEYATLYLAIVDASRVPAQAGAPDEAEHTEPIRIAVPTALAALERNDMHNGFLILALQWLMRHWPLPPLSALAGRCE